MADSGAFSGPRDAAVMETILKEMGMEDYEPNVINQMLEFSYSKFTFNLDMDGSQDLQLFPVLGYVTNILEDAHVYSEHAQKKEIDISDVKLAVQSRMDHSFTTPPPREVRAWWGQFEGLRFLANLHVLNNDYMHQELIIQRERVSIP